MVTEFDAVVIGAGPAGSVSALVLARRGMRTLLVDRREFPRAKVCGGCLAPAGVDRLRTLGILEEVSGVFGGSLTSARVVAGGRSVSVPIRAYAAVERASFDAALVGTAVREGVVFRDGCLATVGRDDAVTLRTPTGRSETVRGGVVVVADGLSGAALRDRAEFAWRIKPGCPVGLGAMVPSVPCGETSFVERGEVVMAVGSAGYVGIADLGFGSTAVAAAVSPGAVARRGAGPVVAGVLREAGIDDAGVHGARWKGVAPLTRRRRRFASGRVLVVGDAARYVEPITGEGMSWGMVCGSEIGPFAARAARRMDVSVAWRRRCDALLRWRGAVCRAAVWAAGSPWARCAAGVGGVAGLVTPSLCFGGGGGRRERAGVVA